MKRISLVMIAAMLLGAPGAARAQDAALKERLDKLEGHMQDLLDAKEAQNKRIEELARQIRDLQEQQNKPNASYVTQDDYKQLVAKLQEVDRKRQDDSEHVVKELDGIRKALTAAPARPSRPVASGPAATSGDGSPPPSAGDKDHYEYEVKDGDTLSAIAAAYSEQGIKVTVKQILAANPGVKAETLRPRQKIIIPKSQ